MILSFFDAIFSVFIYAAIAFAVGPIIITQDYSNLDYIYYSFVLLIARLVTRIVMAKLNSHLGYLVERDLRFHLVDRLIEVGPLSSARNSKLPAVFVDAVDVAVPYFTHYMTAMRYAMTIPLVFLVAVYIVSPLHGTILFAMCPLIPVFMIFIGKRAERINQRQWVQITRLAGHFQEAMRRINVIKMFNLEKFEIQKIHLLNKRWRIETVQILKIAFLSALALEFFSTVGVAFCAITLGFGVYEYGFDYTVALFILLCAPEFFLPLRNLGQNYHSRMNAVGAVTSMLELLNSKDTLAYSGGNHKGTVSVSSDSSFDDGLEIRFEGVSSQYGDGRYGLQDRSFVFEKNKITALVGPSGSGKSTTLMLCAALLEKSGEGRILINGHDIETLDIIDYRRQISYIPQNPYLFFGSVRSNLDLYNAGIPDGELIDTLRKVGAEDLVERFEAGLDHKILDENSGVSGGEARLIALARSILSQSRILLLDEPTASLDSESEAVFLDALKSIANDKTVIIAAHRKELINFADNIVNL